MSRRTLAVGRRQTNPIRHDSISGSDVRRAPKLDVRRALKFDAIPGGILLSYIAKNRGRRTSIRSYSLELLLAILTSEQRSAHGCGTATWRINPSRLQWRPCQFKTKLVCMRFSMNSILKIELLLGVSTGVTMHSYSLYVGNFTWDDPNRC